MKPEWLTEENGIWVFDESKVVEVIAGFLKNWLEDSVPVNLYEKMKKTTEMISEDKESKEVVKFFDTLFGEKSVEFDSAINKLTPVSENS
tara:strand:- start:358 stop:627 length:270 start_codon:yes stop_codon:yes gene_type:complete